MDDLGKSEQTWLDVLRSSDEPNADDRARVRAAIVASIGGAAAGGAAAGGAAGAGIAKSGAAVKVGAAVFLSSGWKLGVAVVSLAVLGAVAATVATRSPPPSRFQESPVAATEPAALVIADPASDVAKAPGAEPLPRAEPAASVRPATRAHQAARSTPSPFSAVGDDVDAELALLAQAQRALERSEPNAALEALAAHERDHPRGALALEREGLRAVASCDAKRSDGRALAERFVRVHPSAPLVARVRAACLSR